MPTGSPPLAVATVTQRADTGAAGLGGAWPATPDVRSRARPWRSRGPAPNASPRPLLGQQAPSNAPAPTSLDSLLFPIYDPIRNPRAIVTMSGIFLTADQAAKRLDLHPKTVRRLIREKRLRAHKIGKSWRILASDLEAFAGATREDNSVNIRVTTVIELAPISDTSASTLANRLTALVHGRGASTPAHLSSAYDPAHNQLKVVFIAPPSDSSAFLSALNVMAQDL